MSSDKISDHETIKIIIKCDEPKNEMIEKVLSWKNYFKEKLIDNLSKL